MYAHQMTGRATCSGRATCAARTDLLANEEWELVNGHDGQLGLHLGGVLIWTLLNLRSAINCRHKHTSWETMVEEEGSTKP